MKTVLSLFVLAFAALAVAGCTDSRAESVPASDPVPAATYKAGHGVQLTPRAREHIGLETGEVGSHRFAGLGDSPALPAAALLRTVRGDFVYVANGGWFLRTPVTVGAADGTHVEITDGLYEGDTVVTRGVPALALAEIQALNGGVGCADGH